LLDGVDGAKGATGKAASETKANLGVTGFVFSFILVLAVLVIGIYALWSKKNGGGSMKTPLLSA
jgi:hypothetical protein